MPTILTSNGQYVEISESELAPPGESSPPPHNISDRQFVQGLAVAGLITEAEAEEWVGPGTVPAGLLALVDALPEPDRFAARMLLRGATTFDRYHPLVDTLSTSYEWSSAQTDEFWRMCATL